jgi:HPt (histidine-containing phosphotransfer) domain-containing protein
MKSPAQPGVPAEAALSRAIDRLWARFLPEIRERVAILEAAASAVSAGKLSRTRRQAAQAAAHKLAGVLGTFSLTRGTVLAREAEVAYSGEVAPSATSGKRLASLAAELRAMIESRK